MGLRRNILAWDQNWIAEASFALLSPKTVRSRDSFHYGPKSLFHSFIDFFSFPFLFPTLTHLQPRSDLTQILNLSAVHPAVIQFGLKTQAEPGNVISGANARCLGMLEAFKQLIRDYHPPPDQSISRHFESVLKPQINFLVNFRPLSISMGNAIRYLKKKVGAIPLEMPEEQVPFTFAYPTFRKEERKGKKKKKNAGKSFSDRFH